MNRLLGIIFFLSLFVSPNSVFGDEPIVFIHEGEDLMSEGQKEFVVSEIAIQCRKIESLLGLTLDGLARSFSIHVVQADKVYELSGLELAKAVTVDGEIFISLDTLESVVLRHEVMHSILFSLVKEKLPWWVEEGLAEVLSGELDQESQGSIANSKIEIRYKEAGQRVLHLVNKCGFRSFGDYLTLIEQRNTERYSYNKIFNDKCLNESRK